MSEDLTLNLVSVTNEQADRRPVVQWQTRQDFKLPWVWISYVLKKRIVSLFTSISVNSLAIVQSFELLKSKPLKVNQGSLAAYCWLVEPPDAPKGVDAEWGLLSIWFRAFHMWRMWTLAEWERTILHVWIHFLQLFPGPWLWFTKALGCHPHHPRWPHAPVCLSVQILMCGPLCPHSHSLTLSTWYSFALFYF